MKPSNISLRAMKCFIVLAFSRMGSRIITQLHKRLGFVMWEVQLTRCLPVMARILVIQSSMKVGLLKRLKSSISFSTEHRGPQEPLDLQRHKVNIKILMFIDLKHYRVLVNVGIKCYGNFYTIIIYFLCYCFERIVDVFILACTYVSSFSGGILVWLAM